MKIQIFGFFLSALARTCTKRNVVELEIYAFSKFQLCTHTKQHMSDVKNVMYVSVVYLNFVSLPKKSLTSLRYVFLE